MRLNLIDYKDISIGEPVQWVYAGAVIRKCGLVTAKPVPPYVTIYWPLEDCSCNVATWALRSLSRLEAFDILCGET